MCYIKFPLELNVTFSQVAGISAWISLEEHYSVYHIKQLQHVANIRTTALHVEDKLKFVRRLEAH
jgi:hypothetical protein